MPGLRSDLLSRDPRLTASASLDQFSGASDPRRPSGLNSGSLQRNASAASLSRMLESGTSEHYLNQPRDRLDEDLRRLQNGQQMASGTALPDNSSSRSDLYQLASAAIPSTNSVYRAGEHSAVRGHAPAADIAHPVAESSGDRRPQAAASFSQTSAEGLDPSPQAVPSTQTPVGGNIDCDQFYM
jgi:hypothetical protein